MTPARAHGPHAAARGCGGRSRGVQRTLASLRQQQGKERRRLEKKAAEAERRVARLTLAIADGGNSIAEIRVVLSAQVAERDACRRALADLEAEPTLVMMPNLAERYRRSISDLAQALSGDVVEIEQARDALRCLIHAVVATPATEGRGVLLEVRGRLAAMVGVANDNSARWGAGGCMLKGGCGSRIWSKTYIGYRACLMAAEMRLSSDLSHLPAYGALKPGA